MATAKKKMTHGPDGQTQIDDVAPAPAPPAPNEHVSFFDDDEGDNLYSGTIALDGTSVRVRELSASEVDAYKTDVRAVDDIANKSAQDGANWSAIFQEAIALMQRDEKNAVAVAELQAKGAKVPASDENSCAELVADAISALRRASCVRVINAAVTGWDLTRPGGEAVPFSRETATKLRFSRQNELADKIVQRSVFGTDFSRFLAQS